MTLPSTETMIDIPVSDDIDLSATYFKADNSKADNSQIGTILICPAMGVEARFYTSFSRYLCSEGFHVLLIDYQGIGASRTKFLRGCTATMQGWAEQDIAASLSWIKQKLPASPIAIVGHSAGGQLSCISNSNVPVDALLLVACQSGYWRHWSGIRRLGMFFLWYALIPGLSRICGYFPARKLKLGEDLPKGVALQWAQWGRSPMYIASEAHLADRYSKFKGPVLAYSFTDDDFAPAKAVKALLSYFSNAPIEHKVIAPQTLSQKKIGHFGFFRERIGKESLWKESTQWLKSALKHS